MGCNLQSNNESNNKIVMAEIRPIPGFPDYFADTDGNVWSNAITGDRVTKTKNIEIA